MAQTVKSAKRCEMNASTITDVPKIVDIHLQFCCKSNEFWNKRVAPCQSQETKDWNKPGSASDEAHFDPNSRHSGTTALRDNAKGSNGEGKMVKIYFNINQPEQDQDFASLLFPTTLPQPSQVQRGSSATICLYHELSFTANTANIGIFARTLCTLHGLFSMSTVSGRTVPYLPRTGKGLTIKDQGLVPLQ